MTLQSWVRDSSLLETDLVIKAMEWTRWVKKTGNKAIALSQERKGEA